jgi:hypothetical protein
MLTVALAGFTQELLVTGSSTPGPSLTLMKMSALVSIYHSPNFFSFLIRRLIRSRFNALTCEIKSLPFR